jgi:hypothetical protein
MKSFAEAPAALRIMSVVCNTLLVSRLSASPPNFFSDGDFSPLDWAPPTGANRRAPASLPFLPPTQGTLLAASRRLPCTAVVIIAHADVRPSGATSC